jgi:hypothetical protein
MLVRICRELRRVEGRLLSCLKIKVLEDYSIFNAFDDIFNHARTFSNLLLDVSETLDGSSAVFNEVIDTQT